MKTDYNHNVSLSDIKQQLEEFRAKLFSKNTTKRAADMLTKAYIIEADLIGGQLGKYMRTAVNKLYRDFFDSYQDKHAKKKRGPKAKATKSFISKHYDEAAVKEKLKEMTDSYSKGIDKERVLVAALDLELLTELPSDKKRINSVLGTNLTRNLNYTDNYKQKDKWDGHRKKKVKDENGEEKYEDNDIYIKSKEELEKTFKLSG